MEWGYICDVVWFLCLFLVYVNNIFISLYLVVRVVVFIVLIILCNVNVYGLLSSKFIMFLWFILEVLYKVFFSFWRLVGRLVCMGSMFLICVFSFKCEIIGKVERYELWGWWCGGNRYLWVLNYVFKVFGFLRNEMRFWGVEVDEFVVRYFKW